MQIKQNFKVNFTSWYEELNSQFFINSSFVEANYKLKNFILNLNCYNFAFSKHCWKERWSKHRYWYTTKVLLKNSFNERTEARIIKLKIVNWIKELNKNVIQLIKTPISLPQSSFNSSTQKLPREDFPTKTIQVYIPQHSHHPREIFVEMWNYQVIFSLGPPTTTTTMEQEQQERTEAPGLLRGAPWYFEIQQTGTQE